jgi:hypothetical protein
VRRNDTVQALCALMYFYHMPFSEVKNLTPFQIHVLLEWLYQFFEREKRRFRRR